MGRMDALEAMIERAIVRQEEVVRCTSVQFAGESDAQFCAKVERRIAHIVVCFPAYELPGIDRVVARYCDATWGGYKFQRRCADQLDNVYVWRG